MKDLIRVKRIDDVLVEFFCRVDPDHIVPDEVSYSPDRSKQYKAPDHFLFDRSILVERKSLTVEHETWLSRINTVTKEQGEEYVIFGEFGLNALFRDLDDPERAKDRFAKLSLNQFEKRVKEAREKFREHAAATGIVATNRIVIVSEDGSAALMSDGKLVEWFMGQLFLRSTPINDKVGLTDSIIYIRDPAHTIVGDGGHWFKWVTRASIPHENRRDITGFGSMLFAAMASYFDSLGETTERFGLPRQLIT